ncbi:hypothetical protein ACBR40_25815 [Nonomuraea sp. AD125B]|uniref:hypothetical protein n=1 Tax=Nonomuraea TaxID=83681 RepID=UPI0031CEB433
MRRRSSAVLAVALLAANAVAATGCAACTVVKGPPVSPPAAGAPADAVVRAYLAGIRARDAEVVRAVTAPSFHQRYHDYWSDPIRSWIDVRVSEVGAPAPDTYGPGGYRQVRRVFVTVDVRRCDEEPPNDDPHYPYTFLLGRQSDAAPWKIIDMGGLG